MIAVLLLLVSTWASASTLKVAVIDTGLDLKDARFSQILCKDGHQDFTGTGIADTHGHGTHVVGLIQRNAGDSSYCLVILKYYDEKLPGNMERYREALDYAVQIHANIVNYSGGGEIADSEELSAFVSHPEITFVVAAGNDGKPVKSGSYSYYPAAYALPNLRVVGSTCKSGERADYSNYGPEVSAWEMGTGVVSTLPGGFNGSMSGTSQATAIYTGKLIYARTH